MIKIEQENQLCYIIYVWYNPDTGLVFLLLIVIALTRMNMSVKQRTFVLTFLEQFDWHDIW